MNYRRLHQPICAMIIVSVTWTVGCARPSTSQPATTTTSQKTQDSAQQQSAQEMFDKAQQLIQQGDDAGAVEILNQVLEKEPRASNVWRARGRAHFRLGNLEKSLSDFDELITLRPAFRNSLWERGITLYYLDRFKEGAEQFKSYQSYHDQDVENSVWEFICRAKVDGVESARKRMLVIEKDTRVPMMEIYGLFRGDLEPADVAAAVDTDNHDAQAVAQQQLYADLYLALYYDSRGQMDLARQHARLAADCKIDGESPTNNYMWHVARIHAQTLENRSSSSKK